MELLKDFIARFYGGMTWAPLIVCCFILFSWKKIRWYHTEFAWAVSFFAAIIGWRIMWLGSLGGRGDRYYMIWGIGAMLLSGWALWGWKRWGHWLYIDRWRICRRLAPVVLIVGTAIPNSIVSLYNSGSKTFLNDVVVEARAFAERYQNEMPVFLDYSNEVYRLEKELPEDLPQIQAIRYHDTCPEQFRNYRESVFNPAMERYSHLLLFIREEHQGQFVEEFGKEIHGRIIGEYPFRKFHYLLFEISPMDEKE